MWPINSMVDGETSGSKAVSEKSKAKQRGEDEENSTETSGNSDLTKQANRGKAPKSNCPEASTLEDPHNTKRKSASRDSSLNDDPKSLMDSISAASVHQNWGGKEMVDDDPSISSIKGDSVSATIADYNRKHRAQTFDSQSRNSAQLGVGGECSVRTDDLSSNINFYTAGGSTSGVGISNKNNVKPGDFLSVSSNVNVDAFDIIEESSNVSSSEENGRSTSSKDGYNKSRKDGRSRPHRHKVRRSLLLGQALEIDELPQEASVYQIEPIIIRGNGNLTLFGLSNSFSTEFPSTLIGRVSREEFDHTMRRINSLLRDQQSLSAKLLLFGGICCCCSLGFSLVWPSIALRKRSKMTIEKFLTNENSRLYSKLGLNWKLAEQRCYSNHAFVEYVLMIEFTPKMNLFLPD